MIAVALIFAGWCIVGFLVSLAVGPLLRRSQQRYRPRLKPQDVDRMAHWQEIDMPLVPDQERQLYMDYKRTAALQPGGLIVSRRA